jgi:hypothetical protein
LRRQETGDRRQESGVRRQRRSQNIGNTFGSIHG